MTFHAWKIPFLNSTTFHDIPGCLGTLLSFAVGGKSPWRHHFCSFAAKLPLQTEDSLMQTLFYANIVPLKFSTQVTLQTVLQCNQC